MKIIRLINYLTFHMNVQHTSSGLFLRLLLMTMITVFPIYSLFLHNFQTPLTILPTASRRLINRFVPTFSLTELTDNGEREV
ncbi:hypothetical protein T07_3191 [Trichinella nelsoni]|uniref:Uncharacterized protein n=1 Tax=Trichinella nelsoni TaxID=6336 RepID=A0A0V0SDY1_9BILA|nr:hypothetical protein T07_3191 [Trichinella nelsoni]